MRGGEGVGVENWMVGPDNAPLALDFGWKPCLFSLHVKTASAFTLGNGRCPLSVAFK